MSVWVRTQLSKAAAFTPVAMTAVSGIITSVSDVKIISDFESGQQPFRQSAGIVLRMGWFICGFDSACWLRTNSLVRSAEKSRIKTRPEGLRSIAARRQLCENALAIFPLPDGGFRPGTI